MNGPQPILRNRPVGLTAGAPSSRITGPTQALALVARPLALAERELRLLVHSEVAAVPAVSRHLLDAGGKRLRPALTALGALAIGEAPRPRLMCVGELLHLGSLLHDDVVDGADRRRGRPAAHRVYGNAMAVLGGDFCLARAVQLATQEGGAAVTVALGDVITAMAEGEVLQLVRAGQLGTSVPQYLQIIEKKSAALISWCVSAPALSTGQDEVVQALRQWALQVGTAFQITDDVLDYRSGTGKSSGADLRERKVTLPLVLAMEHLPGLREQLQARAPTEQELPELMGRIRDSGALDQALDLARQRAAAGVEALSVLPEGPGRQALEVLGEYLASRKA